MTDREREVIQWAKARMDARDFVVLDTETTGLDETAQVVSIAIVNAWGRLAYSSLVKPTGGIDEMGKAFAVHGISAAMVATAPLFDDVWQLALKHIGPNRVVAYNAAFDFKMIVQTLRFEPIPFRSVWDCAMLQYAQFVGTPGLYEGYRWHRLATACMDMGLPTTKFHDAASDALATYGLVKALSEVADREGIPASI